MHFFLVSALLMVYSLSYIPVSVFNMDVVLLNTHVYWLISIFHPLHCVFLIAPLMYFLYYFTLHLAPAAPASNLVTVFVNGAEVKVPPGSTVLQACEMAGEDIPRFCFHERLSVAGNCRMCLVEVEKVPKPVASCAYPLTPNMRIKTNTVMVHKAREGVMEFLLANHPLDCPICDQGGECDLQEQSMHYGSDRSRFREIKRTVEDKNLGPIVKTVMTRCIHCTRCVRFASEVAGVPTLGTTGRGNNMEIGTYTPKVFDSEMSGNVIDLCPVGALTSKPYAFKARPWELRSTESVDVMDAVGSNIRIDARGPDVLRVLPRLNEAINEEWISDKTRHAHDGLLVQRLDTPMVKNRATGEFAPATWPEAMEAIAKAVKPLKRNEMKAIAGDMADLESMVALKDMFSCLGSTNFAFSDGINIPADFRSSYLFNSTIQGIDQADFVLLVGTNPRMEAAVINARIRKINFQDNVPVYGVGPKADLALETEWLGNDYSILKSIADKSHPIAAELAAAKRPLIVVGMSAFKGVNATATPAVLSGIQAAYPNTATAEWNGVSILHTSAARVAAQDIGFVPGPTAVAEAANAKPKFLYLLGADTDYVKTQADANTFVVYQGHNGDIGAAMADVILPSAAFTEKSATYVNTEGRVQRTLKATDVKGQAKEDWKVVRALSEVLGVALPYDNHEILARRITMIAPHLLSVGTIEKPSMSPILPAGVTAQQVLSQVKPQPFEKYYENHFMTNALSRASETMAKTSAQLPVSRNSYL